MAIPWLSVIRAVPWSDVVKNAPRAVDGAKDLWSKVSSKSTRASGATRADVVPVQPSDDASCIASLAARVADTETAVQTLREQLRESSKLIESLAEQNAQLVQQIEVNRARLRRLVIGVCLGGLALACAIVFMRP